MKDIIVETLGTSYPICFRNNFDDIGKYIDLAKIKNQKACIITDSNVNKLYAEEIKKALETVCSQVFVYAFEAGEKQKGLETITEFYKFFLENKLERKSVIIALGGGVTGDMAGFAAATYLRGIKFVQIPTTLLAQVDSSVGGKVGVDFGGSKNIIGAFYQPEFVYINVETIKSLPEREFAAGMAEVIKYGPILSQEFYDFIKENKEKIILRDSEIMQEIIEKSCIFKADVVSQDEKENGLREILNFGHTIGHAVESCKGFELLHGECVGIGMAAVMYISQKRDAVTKEVLEDFIQLLKYFKIPVKAEGLKSEDVYNMMFNDKKVKNNKIFFVLIKEFGKYYSTSDVTKDEIIEAINYIL